jgi:hypothetical protein
VLICFDVRAYEDVRPFSSAAFISGTSGQRGCAMLCTCPVSAQQPVSLEQRRNFLHLRRKSSISTHLNRHKKRPLPSQGTAIKAKTFTACRSKPLQALLH